MDEGNQRTRLTVRLIREALMRLLEDMDFDRVTVSAICKEAGVNRSTFYRYYNDQFELLESIELELIEELESHGSIVTDLVDLSEEARQAILRNYVDFFNCIERRSETYRILATRVRPNIFEKTYAIRTSAYETALEKDYGKSQASYAANFMVAGGQKVVTEWICRGRNRETPDEMAEMVLNMTNGVIERLCKLN